MSTYVVNPSEWQLPPNLPTFCCAAWSLQLIEMLNHVANGNSQENVPADPPCQDGQCWWYLEGSCLEVLRKLGLPNPSVPLTPNEKVLPLPCKSLPILTDFLWVLQFLYPFQGFSSDKAFDLKEILCILAIEINGVWEKFDAKNFSLLVWHDENWMYEIFLTMNKK